MGIDHESKCIHRDANQRGYRYSNNSKSELFLLLLHALYQIIYRIYRGFIFRHSHSLAHSFNTKSSSLIVLNHSYLDLPRGVSSYTITSLAPHATLFSSTYPASFSILIYFSAEVVFRLAHWIIWVFSARPFDWLFAMHSRSLRTI